jgi:hypothetical protein
MGGCGDAAAVGGGGGGVFVASLHVMEGGGRTSMFASISASMFALPVPLSVTLSVPLSVPKCRVRHQRHVARSTASLGRPGNPCPER